MEEYEERRNRMVEHHIAGRGVSNRAVLEAMRRIPRHEFVLPANLEEAYADYPLPIGYGQTISQPYIVAVMTELLDVLPEHKVLEIGTGCGYQAAILAGLAAHVVSIERIPELAEKCRETFERLEINNVAVHVSDGTLGWPKEAPYDRIMVTAAAPSIPEALTKQLAERGRMVLPVGSEHVQDLIVVIKEMDGVKTETHGGCRFVKLIGEQGWTEI